MKKRRILVIYSHILVVSSFSVLDYSLFIYLLFNYLFIIYCNFKTENEET